jgi:TonB family protein
MILSKAVLSASLQLVLYLAASHGVAQTLNDQAVQEARDNLNKGVKAFTEQKYDEAAQFIEKAVQLDPDFETARMYLAIVYASQFIPGSTDLKSKEMALKAIDTYKQIVDNAKDPAPNKTAMLSIASLYYQLGKYPESREWCSKVLETDPQNAEAYYRIAVIDFDDSFERTGVQGELVELMTPDEIAQTLAVIDEGLQCLEKAIKIHPNYFDAIEYQNLLWREKAKLEKDEKAKAELIHEADRLAQKALDLKLKEQEEAGRYIAIPTPPPKPVKRDPIKVSGNMQESKLIRRVEPVYPELAKRARVEARVLLVVTIDEEGNVSEIRVIAGHPLLVEAALSAVRQWKYSPTLLNGEAVPVIATVTVRFSLAASGETAVPVGD